MTTDRSRFVEAGRGVPAIKYSPENGGACATGRRFLSACRVFTLRAVPQPQLKHELERELILPRAADGAGNKSGLGSSDGGIRKPEVRMVEHVERLHPDLDAEA